MEVSGNEEIKPLTLFERKKKRLELPQKHYKQHFQKQQTFKTT